MPDNNYNYNKTDDKKKHYITATEFLGVISITTTIIV